MKSLFVTNMWPDHDRPWYGTFIQTQAKSLEALGVEVDVLPIRGYASRSEYARAIGELRRRVRSQQYDVVHAHYGHAGVVARFQRRAPLVVSYCGDDLLGTPREDGSTTVRSRMEATVFRRLAHVAAATITKSLEMERALPPACRQRNHVIPNGVDLTRFEPIPQDEARRELQWDPDERAVLFVGDPAVARKNYALAEEVCRRARERAPHVRIRVANGVPPSQIPQMMSAADALLLTSRWEGSPNVVKEAMAAALPVVATPVGDVKERLDGVDGCFAVPADPDALSSALIEAVQRDRAPAAREAVSALSLEAVARRVLSVYEAVA